MVETAFTLKVPIKKYNHKNMITGKEIQITIDGETIIGFITNVNFIHPMDYFKNLQQPCQSSEYKPTVCKYVELTIGEIFNEQ